MNPKGRSLVDLETLAAAPDTPHRPTDADRVGLLAAMGLELAASRLYGLAEQELSEDDAMIAQRLRDQHQSYADAIAGLIGVSANKPDTDVVDELTSNFTTSDTQQFGAAGRDLENSAVATHTALLGGYESLSAIDLAASIITIEARHAVVLTSLAGYASDLDQMLGNDADALELTGTTGGAK